ncbi:hypothetical protein ACJIZ3_023545 [Penstemon smallii]|uniref:Uncharacterized protein n=1 Tax=Penstemon smallii TaxID=265156 RepID=A0ABD3TPD7_9LAMI
MKIILRLCILMFTNSLIGIKAVFNIFSFSEKKPINLALAKFNKSKPAINISKPSIKKSKPAIKKSNSAAVDILFSQSLNSSIPSH